MTVTTNSAYAIHTRHPARRFLNVKPLANAVLLRIISGLVTEMMRESARQPTAASITSIQRARNATSHAEFLLRKAVDRNTGSIQSAKRGDLFNTFAVLMCGKTLWL